VLQEQDSFAEIHMRSAGSQTPSVSAGENTALGVGRKPCHSRTCRIPWAAQGIQQQGLAWTLSGLHKTKSTQGDLIPYFSSGFVPIL